MLQPWPDPYVPGDPKGGPKPSLSREQCILLGSALAYQLVFDTFANPDFSRFYLRLVKNFYRTRETEFDNFRNKIDEAQKAINLNIDMSRFNQHDFANVQRAAWLTVVRAITRLVALNPFDPNFLEENPWLNAKPDGSSANETGAKENPHLFFGVPDPVGRYALTDRDFDEYWGQLRLPRSNSNVATASRRTDDLNEKPLMKKASSRRAPHRRRQ
jgi:hypothetical protein